MIRGTLDLKLAGDRAEVETAASLLADRLAEDGFIFDEDFETLHGAEWAVIGLRLRTRGAILAALEALPSVGAYLIETNPELME